MIQGFVTPVCSPDQAENNALFFSHVGPKLKDENQDEMFEFGLQISTVLQTLQKNL